jgi:hypothetical protein
MDGDASASNIRWTHTGAQHAEAGFDDPTLGWVGVRADAGGGGVHASLVPGSNEAAQMLGSHLAGLNEYLAERHPSVGAVTVTAPESGEQSSNAQSGFGSNSGAQSGSQSFNQQDSSGNSGQSNSGAGWVPAASNPISTMRAGTSTASLHGLASPGANQAASINPPTNQSSTGNNISVIA